MAWLNDEDVTNKLCDIKWKLDKDHSNVLSPIYSPFTYSRTILDKLVLMGNTEVVEFLVGTEVVFSCPVKMAKDMFLHISKILENGDLTKLDLADTFLLKRAYPWDFWKSKNIQEIINKIL